MVLLFVVSVDATLLIGCSTPYGTDDRHLGKGLGRTRHNCAVCPSRGRVAHPIASSTSSGTAWQHGHFCGFASGFPVRLRLHRPIAKASVCGLELKSRPRLGAICRQEPGDRDGSWPRSVFRTAVTIPGCFHTRLFRPFRPIDPPSHAFYKCAARQRNIPQAQAKPMVRPNGIGDDGPREPEALQTRL
jgi:hypothetical protein